MLDPSQVDSIVAKGDARGVVGLSPASSGMGVWYQPANQLICVYLFAPRRMEQK